MFLLKIAPFISKISIFSLQKTFILEIDDIIFSKAENTLLFLTEGGVTMRPGL